MIWYETPAIVGKILFLVLLLTTASQMTIALEAGIFLRDKRSILFIRMLYGVLSAISAVFAWEAMTAIASVEGGIFLSIPAYPRYASILPILLFLYESKRPVKLAASLRPPTLSFFIPLLRLPALDWAPAPLSVALATFATMWLLFDAVQMLVSIRSYSRKETTRGVLAHIIRSIDHGICVANRRGWILETNPAFKSLCKRIGINKTDHIREIDAALRALQNSERVRIIDLENGKSIRTDEAVLFLQRSYFKTASASFIQLSLSDVTEIARAASELERENERLNQNNQQLRAAIADIQLEEAARERERLCRAAHDLWSQRLAMAGLSIDMLLEKNGGASINDTVTEVTEALKEPGMAEHAQPVSDLPEALRGLTAMYGRLGVHIHISGQAAFSEYAKKTLYAVFREALANAVRHAYARHITVRFYEDSGTSGVIIRNACLDDRPDTLEGRGLHDMKTRIHHAGGSIQYKKDSAFELKVAFPKGTKKQEEVFAE
ncbi:MAG: hypothetical protein VB049_07740 [Candidatus Pelethousia sp.]|nr:hypothetical protein [Candidatus Pelethousia sp.]